MWADLLDLDILSPGSNRGVINGLYTMVTLVLRRYFISTHVNGGVMMFVTQSVHL